jgi:hypothetical protein
MKKMNNFFNNLIEYHEAEFFKIHNRKDFPADFELKCGKEFFCKKHIELEYILCKECVFGKGERGKTF